ncbi:MAG: hypothetical protein CFE39_00545 [Comamonadaceae bacterium PBBC2]|nr:MAG: hypothetical protein CFE39_00545 [Comamonadaceae bacterium PBBC2]
MNHNIFSKKRCLFSLMLALAMFFPKHSVAQLVELSVNNKVLGFLFGSTHGAVNGVPINFEKLAPMLAQSRFVVMESIHGYSPQTQKEQLAIGGADTILTNAPKDMQACVQNAYEEMLGDENDNSAVNLDFTSVPFLFAMRYSGYTEALYIPAAQGLGYDQKIISYAKTRKLPLAGLEVAADKIQMLKNISNDDAYAFLSKYCAMRTNLPERKIYLDLKNRIAKSYVSDDMNAFAKYNTDLYKFLGASEDFYRHFVTNRNAVMARKIERMIKNGYQPFFAVGAAHLGGDDGIVNILNANGVTTRIISSGDLK